MAYSLKSTGLAAEAHSVVLVDDDGSTIVDLVAGNTVTPHANVTIGEANWKGAARKFFQTGGSSYTPYGVQWSGTKPAIDSSDTGPGATIICILAGLGGGFGSRMLVWTGGGSPHGLARNGANGVARIGVGTGSGMYALGSTPLPTDMATAFTVAGFFKESDQGQVFIGYESGDIAADSTLFDVSGYNLGSTLGGIGGQGGQGYQNGKYHAVITLPGKRTLSELQSIHNDWFNIFVDTGGTSASVALTPDPATVANGSAKTFLLTRSLPAPVGGVTYNLLSSAPGVATVPATKVLAQGQTETTFDATSVSAGSTDISATNAADSGETDTVALTVLSAIKGVRVQLHDAAVEQASLSGLSALWWDGATPHTFGAPDHAVNNETTDAAGWLEIDLSSVTALALGASGFLMVYKAGATAEDDIVFAGRLAVEDIS